MFLPQKDLEGVKLNYHGFSFGYTKNFFNLPFLPLLILLRKDENQPDGNDYVRYPL